MTSEPDATSSGEPSERPRNLPAALGCGSGIGAFVLAAGPRIYALVLGALGVIFSSYGLMKSRQRPADREGRWVSIIGLVLALLAIVVAASGAE